MASIKNLGNGKYKVWISCGFNDDGSRKRVIKTIAAKGPKDAERQAKTLEVEIAKGQYIEPSGYTLREYVEKVWLIDRQKKDDLAPKTLHRYSELLNLHILKALGNVKLEKLNPILIEKFYNDLRDPVTYEHVLKKGSVKKTTRKLSEQTLRHIHRLISTILEIAFKKGLIKENPCARVEAPKPKKKELSIYSEDQIISLIEALEGAELKFKVCVHIALAGGLRLGELMGLEWSDVDFDNSTITIERSSQYLSGKGIYTKDPKNETFKRTVSLPFPVMSMLADLELNQKKQRLLLGNKWEKSNRLITTETGGPMQPYAPSKWFHQFLIENNLPPLPFHGLRHTSASYLIAQGQDVVTVSKRLGHSNSNTTLGIYAHAFRKRDLEAATKMEGLYSKKEEKQKGVTGK